MNELSIPMINEIKAVMENARKNTARKINNELLTAYWNIGRIIVDNEQTGGLSDVSARSVIIALSRLLTTELGKGFSRSNLFNMRYFYLSYPDVQTVSGRLSWSHYCELLSISDEKKRGFYEKETANSNWSVRELKRQISTSLFERLLLSDGKTNKETVLSLALHGIEISSPPDIIKDPYVFEFLNIPENKPMMESDLEKALVQQIEKF
jgi:hypothetical protein